MSKRTRRASKATRTTAIEPVSSVGAIVPVTASRALLRFEKKREELEHKRSQIKLANRVLLGGLVVYVAFDILLVHMLHLFSGIVDWAAYGFFIAFRIALLFLNRRLLSEATALSEQTERAAAKVISDDEAGRPLLLPKD